MFKKTFIYIKTHKKTGLKYVGKTIKKDVHKYQGINIMSIWYFENCGLKIN